ncbi:MAG: L-seryl-tRNA(Sec) selenium transferase [Christensenellales bacterium]
MSHELHNLLRRIPQVDALLQTAQGQALSSQYSQQLVARTLREILEKTRERILNGQSFVPTQAELLLACAERISEGFQTRKPVVINATGILLHTNLGRAPMAKRAAKAALDAATCYSTLEFDLDTGMRGNRQSHVETLIGQLLGARAALVVNNNAAAVLLMLAAVASGREVVVSRGELVEIGGSFRVPEVMTQSGCILREVGTTNKTKPGDYRAAIGESTAALMKVHTSNYKVMGFTQSVDIPELAGIAREAGLPLLADLGSGALLPLSAYGLQEEPGPRETLAQGAQVVCFSGDKLLGGPQAGILAGDADLIAAMRRHPLMRALRPDKMTLAALEATLQLYRDAGLARRHIPLYQMLGTDLETLRQRAFSLREDLKDILGLRCDVADSEAQLGGGSAPGESLASVALCLTSRLVSADRLADLLRHGSPAVIARIRQDAVLLDLRTVFPEQLPELTGALKTALSSSGVQDA